MIAEFVAYHNHSTSAAARDLGVHPNQIMQALADERAFHRLATVQTEERPHTVREVAAIIGVTRNMVLLLEQSAMKKIRAAIETEAAACGASPNEWLEECFL
jgi:DNA-directed RNA polymerase sigma subunit (sigma70/sigma32)